MLSVLIIDDEPDILTLVKSFLERFGEMQVDIVQSTKEALGIVAKKDYDALVVDFYMPEITGIEFLKILRAKGDTTPVIIFTGVGREHAAIEAINNGADFFLQKGEDPRTQFRELAHMIQQANDRRSVGRSPGTTQRVVAGIMSFSPEAMFAIDRESRVLGWNNAMEELTGVSADIMVGKSDREYAIPFYGKKAPMLIDLVFSEDNELVAHNYNLVSREKGTVIAWTRVVHPDGKELIYWMRAMPIYDGKGVLLGVVGSVRDITDVADTLLKDIAVSGAKAGLPAAGTPVPEQVSGTFLDRITGRAKAEYRKGVKLFYKEGKNEEAIQCFDRAIAIDPNIPDVWNERGLCLKSLGKFEDAQKSIERALEMVPRDEEFLYNYGEVLETIGILHRQNKILKNAIQSFSAVTEINPNNASAWNHLGVCIKETGRDEESRNAFERARAIIRANKDRPVRRRRDTLI